MYSLAPFFIEKFDSKTLLTNDLGNHLFVTEDIFHQLVSGQLTDTNPMFTELLHQGFLYTDKRSYLRDGSEQIRDMKRCLFSSTQLFILVLTNCCNQRCTYCQAGVAKTEKMSIETCRKAIDIAVQSPTGTVTIEFQGGEPTKNPNILRYAIPYAKNVFDSNGKKVHFAIVTNLTDTDPELLQFLIDEGVSISTSLDGPQILHDINRPLASGRSSFDAWEKGLQLTRELAKNSGKSIHIGAIETTTKQSLAYPKDIVNAYIDHGFSSLYIRPLTPLGKAQDDWSNIGYSPEEYLSFYKTVIHYMIECNLQGNQITETTAVLYLSRLLYGQATNHTEFRSPCGAAIGQMAVNYDGNVYTCDEGRMMANMGDQIFRLGSVNNSYKELIQSPVAHAVCSASCVETIPFCSDCAYHPFCSVCPVVNYGMQHDLISKDMNSYRCRISKGIISFLLDLLHNSSEEVKEVLYRWAM